ncbi:DUF309 domain-containing protein [Streptomyces sp. PTM05]|uniref:DUF309 domain-containing protein n=1 Tax=Streptantibioticus parmotrematis TaxID=2873249 RepID=A0ABS7QY38_9ACTN|nr:DUF309 domain-containing protein [Streptantibioticus parmotrematis]MBY8886697.1 DUF309 domain-containing protein [Streptantibioticus parmotrematis]
MDTGDEERRGDDEPWREGGDPACWLNAVCPACGRVRERPGTPVCEHCGAGPDDPDDDAGADRDRDRDTEGRARNARPRDGLGRPLPYGAEGVARQPEGVRRTPDESLAQAQRLLDAGMPFHAHEVLEDAWKTAPPGERGLWRALAQFAVGLTHLARGNAKGARTLLSRAADGLVPYAGPPAPYGIDVPGLIAWARSDATAAAERVPPALRVRGR